MKKIYLVLMLVLILPLVFAQNVYEKETEIDLKIPFEVDGEVASSSATCNISIIYPNSSYLVSNNSMTNKNNGEFNYTLSTTQTDVIGEYDWVMYCCDGSACASGYDNFKITYTGNELDTQSSIIYVVLLFILLFFLVFTILGISRLPNKNITTEDNLIVDINKLKHLRTILWGVVWGLILAINFIIANISIAYLPDSLFGEFFFMIYTIMFSLTLPMVILLFIYIFYKIWQDKEIKNMLERGVQVQSKYI